ncbi:hypothetical protein ACVWZV_000837 [Bradyrhizobium sp. GM5.1]
MFYRRRNRHQDVYPASKGWGEPADCPTGVRHEGGVTSDQALTRNTGTCRSDVKGGLQAARRRKEQSTDAEHRGGIEPSPIQLKVHQFLIEGVPVYPPVDLALLASLPGCDTVPPYPSRVRITRSAKEIISTVLCAIAREEDRPLLAFAGLWTNWTSVRKARRASLSSSAILNAKSRFWIDNCLRASTCTTSHNPRMSVAAKIRVWP